MMLALCALTASCSPSSQPGAAQSGGGPASKSMIGAAANGGSGGDGIVPISTTDNPRQLTGGTVAAPTDGKGSGTGCTGLQCQQHMCSNGGSTTISGRVYDPAGKNPLYNVAVYVPNETPQALPLGASCAKCDSLYTGHPVVTSLTDADGKFTIKDAPDGDDIPLVVQIGKWRKQVKVPHVAQCADTPITEKLTLPRNHIEGDIPAIAISTGAADTLECLLRRIGVDASEYVPGESDMGRVHIFQGSKGMSGRRNGNGEAPNTSPAAPSSPSALWNAQSSLMKYDIVLLSCEGQETQLMNQQALHDYASAGGRVFASHFHYSWFNSGPYANENLATWTAGSNDMGDIGATIVTSFPKGMALQQWLTNTGALVNGELPIKQARHNADVSKANTPSQSWILADGNASPPMATQYLSFNTPTDAAQEADGPGYCGRVVFSDLHVGAASSDDPSQPVPTGCAAGELSPQEKALEFMLFDLSACVIPDDRPPTPPPVLN
jgi:hypothetical protein